MKLDLSDLHSFQCCSCDAEFTADDVRNFIAQWTKALRWIELGNTLAGE